MIRYCKKCNGMIFFALEDYCKMTEKDLKNRKDTSNESNKVQMCEECYNNGIVKVKVFPHKAYSNKLDTSKR